jgi:hypothetical protein
MSRPILFIYLVCQRKSDKSISIYRIIIGRGEENGVRWKVGILRVVFRANCMALRLSGLGSTMKNEIICVGNYGRSGIYDKKEKRQKISLFFGLDLVLLSWPNTGKKPTAVRGKR